MVYMVTQLISDAFNCSGVVGKEFEQVSGEEQAAGFQYLNSLLAKKTADKSGIPYFLRYSANFVVGQEQYRIPGLIRADSVTFFIDGQTSPVIPTPYAASMPVPAVSPIANQVRYSLRIIDRKMYWATPRANQIQSLPYHVYFERQYGGSTNVNPALYPQPLGGASMFVYFIPSQAWQYEIWGLFALESVTAQQDLSLTLDQFYIDYLKFELAERICAEYDYAMPEGAAKQLAEYQMIIDKREQQLDLKQQTISPLTQTCDGVNYAWANLGTGWYPN